MINGNKKEQSVNFYDSLATVTDVTMPSIVVTLWTCYAEM